MGRAYSTNEGKKPTYGVLVGILEGKRPLGRPRLMWKYNAKTYLKEVERGGVGWIGAVQDCDQCRPVFCTVMDLRVSRNSVTFFSRCASISFSSRAEVYEFYERS
jgi:hypothetical protein